MYDTETGQVSFMGEHPSQSLLLQMTPSNNAVRTADSPPVPVEEAVTMLYSVKLASHRRWEGRRVRGHPGHPCVARRGTRATRRVEVASPAKLSVLTVSLHTAHEMVACPSAPAAPVGYIGDTQKMMTQLSKDGQNPVAVVIGCADSRAPIELLFDMRPGDLFVLRNAGNACKPGPGMLVGSAEYAIINLRTKLIVVTGHTKCGAVTAAVEAVRRNADMAEVTGSIGACLMEIVEAAKTAIDELPNASTAEQVQRATEYNVMNTIRKLILNSDVLYNSINLGELQVHGAVFDIFSGRIKWLGQHPDLEKIIGRRLHFHRWKSQPYVPASIPLGDNPARSPSARAALRLLQDGNLRFSSGKPIAKVHDLDVRPSAIVLGGAESRVPIEDVFDVEPGRIVVQRVVGSIAGTQERTAFSSIEYALETWEPPLLLVLVQTNSPIIEAALKQLGGEHQPRAPIKVVLDQLMVSSLRAVMESKDSEAHLSAAGLDLKMRQLATELSAFYSIEMLLRSRRIRRRIEAGTLELHAGVMDASTGRVRYFGEHPMQASMIETAKTIDRLERDEHGVIPRSRWQSAFKDDFREGVSAEERPSPHALGSGSPESISVGQ